MRTSRLKSLFAFVGALSLASLAWGFCFITGDRGQAIKWYENSIPVQIKTDNSVPLSDGLTRATSILAAMQDPARGWNPYMATVQFAPQIVAEGSGGNGNGINEIFFSATIYGLAWGANTLAVTTVWGVGDRRREGDIIFNTNKAWDSYRGPLRTTSSAGPYDMQRVALHELGHVLGLDHPDEIGQSVSAS